MATGRGGSRIKTKLGFLLYGEQGTWKSSLALQFLKFKREDGKPFRVLYIDPEQGSVDSYLDQYENEGVDLQNIYIVYTQSLSEVSEYIRKVKNNDDFYEFDEAGNETDEVYLDADGNPFRPDAVVVDGVTLLYVARQQAMVEFSKKRATVRAAKNETVGWAKEVAIEGAGLEIKDYNTLKFDGQNLILDLLSCGKHFIATCREEDEKEQYKDRNGEIKMMATGRKQPSGFKDIRYNVKTVIHLIKDEDGVIKGIVENKDRTLVHKQDEILIEPSLLDWQVVIDRNRGKREYSSTNNLNGSVDTERKSIEKSNAKFEEEYEANDDPTQNGDLKTVEDYHTEIKKIKSSFSDIDRAKKKTELAKAGFPIAHTKVTNIADLKKYLSILKNNN